MDDYHERKNNNSDELEFNDSILEENGDLDLDLLFNMMDGMFIDESFNPNASLNKQDKSENFSPINAQLIQQMYNLTSWENVETNSDDRPKLCSICYTLTCEHVRNIKSKLNIEDALEDAIHHCEHQVSNEWIFEDVCAKCIITSCEQVNSHPSVDLYVLWDEVDLMQYLQWIQKIDKEYILTN